MYGRDSTACGKNLAKWYHLMRGEDRLTRIHLYRAFRRRLILATLAIFAIGVVVAVALESGRNLWLSVTWAAVCSPILVTIACCILAPVERMAIGLGLSQGSGLQRLRPTVVLWFLCAIALPWMAAWLM